MAESTYEDVLNSVCATIKDLDLRNLHGCLYVQMAFSPVKFPGIYLTVENVSETFRGGTNAADDIQYPVNILIADRNDIDYTKPLGCYLYWRQELRKAFHNKRLEGVDASYNCEILPGNVAETGPPPTYHQFFSRLLLLVTVRECRREDD